MTLLKRLNERGIASVRAFADGLRYAKGLPVMPLPEQLPADNRLQSYFDSITEGPGIWKWEHYFPVYDRHLARFRGEAPVVVEIGVFSGGSLPMWREYFGPESQIHGIDIERACSVYADDGISIHIGDQADETFWRRFLKEIGPVDIVLDDGGHEAYQQIATLKAVLPAISPGGVYVCEDIHGPFQAFHSFVDGLTRPINDVSRSVPSPVQQHIESVHRYPMMVVIEKPASGPRDFRAPRHGTQWQPFKGLAEHERSH
jgi:Methyltransferase domain